ncbi:MULTISPECIES: alanine dehydrogenase [Candidatus Ichthyocystis]|uniref:Alanine dehydrogenase n=1 Tax=Candidatus Ichthyocystis hellenicum TaxID=1561003 RepID=A0A0S4M1D0_9BURK|nr:MULTISPECIES: alanine dehydrogenase [Ichthyocystis]CUT17587.1 Alanine dehydrogenase [Candidatus Ichthyocystis hellenicum]
MIVATVKEIKNHEYRVGILPVFAKEYIKHGHTVLVEKGAGIGVGATDDMYIAAGATIVDSVDEIFDKAQMIVKVKEPQPEEVKKLRQDCVLYTYLHLAADLELTKGLQQSGSICIAYETVTNDHGGLPLLLPMSEVAGNMSVQLGAHCLEKEQGGKGILLAGVPGTRRGHVVILGGGTAGTGAARIAVGMGAKVTILDKSLSRLKELDILFGNRIHTRFAITEAFEEVCSTADLVIGSILIPGATAPKVVTREILRKMEPKSVIVDISIDQGGCFETSRPTSHSNPTFIEENIIHYCVTNMPGAVPQTSTIALNNATLQYGLEIADKGWKKALLENAHLRNGLNVCKGKVTYETVAKDLNLQYVPAAEFLQ